MLGIICNEKKWEVSELLFSASSVELETLLPCDTGPGGGKNSKGKAQVVLTRKGSRVGLFGGHRKVEKKPI